MKIEQSTILIAGGASGLGEATARYFAARGAFCVVLDRDEARGRALAQALQGRVAYVHGDVTRPDDVDRALDAGDGRPTRLAVICAMMPCQGGVLDDAGAPLDLDLYRKALDVNLTGTFNVLSRSAAHFRNNEPDQDGQRGVIVTTGSIAGLEGPNGIIAYASAKAAVMGMTLPAARDLRPFGVRVACIAPGTFDSPAVAALPDEYRKGMIDGSLFPQRLGHPEEFAKLALHIFENSFINGEVIRLDSGSRLPYNGR